MHTMYYANEVRSVEEFRTDTSMVKEQEDETGARCWWNRWRRRSSREKYHDTYRDNLQAMIDAKVKGQEVVTPPDAEPAKVIDIMEALKQSLAAAKKPPASVETLNEESQRKRPRGRRKRTRLVRGATCPPGAADPYCSPGRCIPSSSCPGAQRDVVTTLQGLV